MILITPTPITPEGYLIRQEPLTPDHQDGLAEDGRLRAFWFTFVPEPGQTGVYIADAFDGQL